jgi:hypothetical protein
MKFLRKLDLASNAFITFDDVQYLAFVLPCNWSVDGVTQVELQRTLQLNNYQHVKPHSDTDGFFLGLRLSRLPKHFTKFLTTIFAKWDKAVLTASSCS